MEEPKLRLGNGELKKPDLVVVDRVSNSAVVCDAGVHWEGATKLAVNWYNKRAVYNTEAMVEKVKLIYDVREVRCLPIIVGASGGWTHLNYQALEALSIA